MKEECGQSFLIGLKKGVLYFRIVVHVAMLYGSKVVRGKLGVLSYVLFLKRAALFLKAMRHGKVVRLGRLYHLHLYIPAYPSPAFFHLLNKFLRPDPGAGTVVFSMTKACAYRCPHCYQRNDAGMDLNETVMVRVAKEMQELGVSFFDVEGGEPFLRPERVKALLENLDSRAEVWINSTGDHATKEVVESFKRLGLAGVMVSIHSPDPVLHDSFTGVKGSFEVACSFLRMCREIGIFTAINCCPSAKAIVNGDIEDMMALGKRLGCSYVQVIHEKPSGAWLSRTEELVHDMAVLDKTSLIHLKYNSEKAFAGYPSIAAQVFEEDKRRFGCTAGGIDRFYLGADGEVQPCEFLNVSFGNVQNEEFNIIFRRMRSFFEIPGTHWLCCTQARSINECIETKGLTRTPVPWPISRTLVESWEKGEPTPLYKRLGMYGRR